MERRNKNVKQKGNGEGTIYYSDKLKKYIAQYYEPSGKRKTLKQRKNEKVSDFKKRFNNAISSINQGTYIETSNISLLQILNQHIQQKLDDGITEEISYKRDLATLNQIKKCCNNFINLPIQKVSVEDVEKSKKEIREYGKTSIDKMWRLLNKGFKIAYSRRKITFNIMEDETLIKPVSKKELIKKPALTPFEEKNLIKKISRIRNEQYRNVVLLQLYTGARIGEILALSRDCIDMKNNTIKIYRTLTQNKLGKVILGSHTKTFDKKTNIDKGKRTFPMTSDIKKIIKNILEQKIVNIHNLLFWDYKDNTFIKPHEINSCLKRFNEKAHICDFDLSSHVLRHTFVTRCQEKGMPLVVLQAIVGHIEGSPLTNNTYTDVSLDFMRQELKKLN